MFLSQLYFPGKLFQKILSYSKFQVIKENNPTPCGENSECSITSPNYPNNYPNSAQKTFKLEVLLGYRIMLTFTDFALEDCSTCCFDKVIGMVKIILKTSEIFFFKFQI